MMTTKKCLELMVRAIGIGVGSISKGNWCQLIFIFCSDKQGSTYEMIFDSLKNTLSDLGLEMSAEYCMADFKI